MKTTSLPQLLTAVISGLLFGFGLYVSQMIDPLKVLRFLDFTAAAEGGWDPSLAFVIAPAILVMFLAVSFGKRRSKPAFDTQFHEPEQKTIDRYLVVGAALFGLGWGMSGICPGPAIALIGFMPDNLLLFLIALFVGSYGGSFMLQGAQRKAASP